MDTFSSAKYLTRMSLFIAGVVVVLVVLAPRFLPVLQANFWFNGFILALSLFGIVHAFAKVSSLHREGRWLDKALSPSSVPERTKPDILHPIAIQLQTHGRIQDGAGAADRVAQRLDESRQVARYLVGLLVFLGLLGTFWGLLRTIFAVGGTIEALTIQSDVAQVFAELRDGLQAPLSGMGIAFSSSLFGLAGSLVVGFLELQVNQACNAFLAHIEDRTQSTSSSTTFASQAPPSSPAMDAALMTQAAEVAHNLAQSLATQQKQSASWQQHMAGLARELAQLNQHLKANGEALQEMSVAQSELRAGLARALKTATPASSSSQGVENLAEQLDKLIIEISRGRQQTVNDLRSELRILGRALTLPHNKK
ncbi:MAG: flagellar motor protein MotA [Pseudomonadota bacterium]